MIPQTTYRKTIVATILIRLSLSISRSNFGLKTFSLSLFFFCSAEKHHLSEIDINLIIHGTGKCILNEQYSLLFRSAIYVLNKIKSFTAFIGYHAPPQNLSTVQNDGVWVHWMFCASIPKLPRFSLIQYR